MLPSGMSLFEGPLRQQLLGPFLVCVSYSDLNLNGRHIHRATLGQINAAILASDTPQRAGRIPGAIGDGIGILEGKGALDGDELIERLVLGGSMHEIGIEIPTQYNGSIAGSVHFHPLHEAHELWRLLQTLRCLTRGT
jgi:hypothetical protein